MSHCKAYAGFGFVPSMTMPSQTVSDCKCDSNKLCELTIG